MRIIVAFLMNYPRCTSCKSSSIRCSVVTELYPAHARSIFGSGKPGRGDRTCKRRKFTSSVDQTIRTYSSRVLYDTGNSIAEWCRSAGRARTRSAKATSAIDP